MNPMELVKTLPEIRREWSLRCDHPECYDRDGHTDGCLRDDDESMGVF
jgi:hypothetical protein